MAKRDDIHKVLIKGSGRGLPDSYVLAFFKSQEATQTSLPVDGTLLITIAVRRSGEYQVRSLQDYHLGIE